MASNFCRFPVLVICFAIIAFACSTPNASADQPEKTKDTTVDNTTNVPPIASTMTNDKPHDKTTAPKDSASVKVVDDKRAINAPLPPPSHDVTAQKMASASDLEGLPNAENANANASSDTDLVAMPHQDTQDVTSTTTAKSISDDLSPLSDEIRAQLHSIPWDVEPEVLNAVEKENEGGHFPWSDEKRPDKFYDSIRGIGGTYIGVGTDQAYVYMGWQRPTLAFAVDYDPWIVCIHYGYMALFDTCNDIACFKKMLDDKTGTYKFLYNTYYADHPNRKQIAKIFRANAHGILRRLNRIAQLDVPTFVTDHETYLYIQKLVRSGRLVTMQANLLGQTALKAISQLLKDHGRTVTTFYTSNAEQYWGYNKAFKANMRAIPWAENGMLMRTIATKLANEDYTYRIMPHRVFLAWLDDPRGSNVYKISQSYVIQTRPPDSPEPPDIPFILDDRMPSKQNR